MKYLLALSIFLLVSCNRLPTSGEQKKVSPSTLSITIKTNEYGSIRDDNRDFSKLFIEFENKTDKQLYLWDFGKEWGCSNLWFEGTCDSNKEVIDTIRPRFCSTWDSNFPSSITIAPNGSIIKSINIRTGYGGWEHSPLSNSKCNKNVVLRAHYESGFEMEHDRTYWASQNMVYGKGFDWRKMIWKGNINSNWLQIKIDRIINEVDSCKIDNTKGECIPSLPAFLGMRITSAKGIHQVIDTMRVSKDIQEILKNLKKINK